MSALTSIEVLVADEVAAAAGLPESRSASTPLRLVTDSAPDGASNLAQTAPDQGQPRSSSISEPARVPLTVPVLTPSAVIAPRPRGAAYSPVRPRGAAYSPVRLTRRGRALVIGLIVAVAAAVALLIALAAAGGAQAASHGQPGGGYQGMHEVVVRPGQTLWSIASRAEPGADPRVVVQQIMSANAMTSTAISAGQLLWVPR